MLNDIKKQKLLSKMKTKKQLSEMDKGNKGKQIQGGPQKCPFDNNFYKNRQTFKIFSLQLQEIYRILLGETTLESIILYNTFSVINTMFVPYTTLLYDSTAATRTLKLSTTLLSISCGMRLIPFLMMFSLVCALFSQTLSFKYPLRK